MLSPVYESGQAALGVVAVTPTRPTVGSKLMVLAGSQPLMVPWLSNFGMEGASQTESGNSGSTLPPNLPVTISAPPLRLNSGSTDPHAHVLPLRSVPLAVSLVRFQMWTFPEPAFDAVVPGQVTSKISCTASVKLVCAGH